MSLWTAARVCILHERPWKIEVQVREGGGEWGIIWKWILTDRKICAADVASTSGRLTFEIQSELCAALSSRLTPLQVIY